MEPMRPTITIGAAVGSIQEIKTMFSVLGINKLESIGIKGSIQNMGLRSRRIRQKMTILGSITGMSCPKSKTIITMQSMRI